MRNAGNHHFLLCQQSFLLSTKHISLALLTLWLIVLLNSTYAYPLAFSVPRSLGILILFTPPGSIKNSDHVQPVD